MQALMALLLLVFTACACNPIDYESDIGFLNSAQANSMEYLVRINNSPCKDMDGKIGLCAKRIASNETIHFHMDGREYRYRFVLKCSSSVNSNFAIDVLEGRALKFKIEPEKFRAVRSFTCIGEIFPEDRDVEVSAGWHVRFVVFDKDYQEREKIYKTSYDGDTYLVLGKHAKYVRAGRKRYKEKTMIELKRNMKVYSESERMRFNYWGY